MGFKMEEDDYFSAKGSSRGNAGPEETEGVPVEEDMALYQEASEFEGAAVVSMIERHDSEEGLRQKVLEITLEDGVTMTLELDSGEKRLNELGYRQELNRVLNFWHLFATGVSAMTTFGGIWPYYGFTLLLAGPAGVIWYWWITVFFVHIIGFSLAEISSSFPTAGSLYFWAAALAGPKFGPIASFITGWLEFIGLSVGCAGVAYAGVQVLSALILISTGGANGGGYVLTESQIFGAACLTVVICAVINSFPIRIVAIVLSLSAIWQVVGAFVIIIALPCIAPKHQSASWVFGHSENNFKDIGNLPTPAYGVILALLLSQYSLYGYDVVAHLSEETKKSDRTGPAAIVASLSAISIIIWLILISFTFSIQDYDHIFSPESVTGGSYQLVQILWDAFEARYGSGTGAEIFVIIIYGSFFFGCVVGVLGGSRVGYALARDNGMPLSGVFRKLTGHRVPMYSVWLTVTIGLLFLLPLLKNATIFYANSSIATIGWVGAYAIPIFFRLVQDERDFRPGPFYMAKYVGVIGGKAVHAVALLWVLYTSIIFNLPTAFPPTWKNFNYAPVAIVVWLVALLSWWFVHARFWFTGPIRELEISPEDASVKSQ